jgi:hypothetical protein
VRAPIGMAAKFFIYSKTLLALTCSVSTIRKTTTIGITGSVYGCKKLILLLKTTKNNNSFRSEIKHRKRQGF